MDNLDNLLNDLMVLRISRKNLEKQVSAAEDIMENCLISEELILEKITNMVKNK